MTVVVRISAHQLGELPGQTCFLSAVLSPPFPVMLEVVYQFSVFYYPVCLTAFLGRH